ncbi:MAG: hypothetical protein AAGA56_13140 [Myxococcota bacterium]
MGCDSESESLPGGVGTEETTAAAGGSVVDAGQGGAGGMEVHPCVDAPPLSADGAGRWREEAAFSPGGAFYGTFEAEAGAWISTSIWDLPADTDVVVRLWNEDGTELLASTDEHLPSYDDIDAMMYHHVATTRTYCLEVLEYDVWAGGRSGARTERSFLLRVYPVSDLWGRNATVIEDRGDNDTVETAQSFDITATESGGVILGRIESASDRDVFRFEGVDPTTSTRVISLSLPGAGDASSFGWGSDLEGRVTVLAADEATILASNTFADMATTCSEYNVDRCLMLVPETVGETYFVVVEAEGDNGDFANAGYSIFTTGVDYAPFVEGEDAGANDLATSPVALSTEPIPGGAEVFIEGELADADDVDWWRLDELPGAEVHVWCGSSFFGSGVEGLTIEAYAADDLQTPVRSATERPDAPVRWGPALEKGEASEPPLPAGSYLFRVSGESLRTNYASSNYQCLLVQVEETAAKRR